MTEATVVDYVDGLNDPVRRHLSIEYISPFQYELRSTISWCGGYAPPRDLLSS